MPRITKGRSITFNGGRSSARAIVRGRLRSRAAVAASFVASAAALSIAFGGTAAMAAGGHAMAGSRQATAAVTGVTWHKLTLVNGWTSSQNFYGTGNPSYAISGGVVYLSGSLHGGTNSNFAVLPKAARPAQWLYMTVYSSGGTRGTLLIKPDGEMLAYSTPAADATNYTSLAAVSYPAAATTAHKLTLQNGWTSAQNQFHTGDPSYTVKNGIVYLSGSLEGGTSNGTAFAFLPSGAVPAHIIYRTVYTLAGAVGEVYIEPSGFLGIIFSNAAQAFTSLAGISFPATTVTQHKITLLNGWKSAQTPFNVGGFSYAIEGGVVYLSGGVKLASGTNNLCAQLPPAARPAHVLYITVYTSLSDASTLRILRNGDVFVSSSPDASASRTLTSLSTVSFPRNS
jgi:hypothetical protein